MICIRTGEEEISIPEGGRELGAGYPNTTPHMRAPLVGRGEMIDKRTVKTTLAGKTAKPWWESMVGLVGWWRRVELELSREEKNTRREETREVNTTNDRKLKEQSKLNFLRKFYPDCSTSPGGKTLKLIHTNNKSELLEHPSDIVRKNILEELSFSPQAKRKAREGGILAELYSPSKRTKILNKINYFENGGLSDLAKPVWKQLNWWENSRISRLWGCPILRRAQLFGLRRSLLLHFTI